MKRTKREVTCLVIAMMAMQLTCVVGCGNRDRAMIIGTWELQIVPDELDQATEISGSTEVEFAGDGTLITRTAVTQKRGTWELASVDDQGETVTLSCQLQGHRFETVITVIDNQTIQMVPPNLFAIETQIDEMTFKRKND